MKNKLLFKSNDTGYWFVPDDLMRKYFNYWFTENKGLDHETIGKIYFLNSIVHDMHDRRYIPIKRETFEPLVDKIMSLLKK